MTRVDGHGPAPQRRLPAEALEQLSTMFDLLGPVAFKHYVSTARLAVVDQSTGEAKVSGFVELWTITPQGPQVVYMPPEGADELAELLRRCAIEARSGLVAVSPAGAHVKGIG